MEFEKPGPASSEQSATSERVLELMQQLQKYGQPPEDLAGENVSGMHACVLVSVCARACVCVCLYKETQIQWNLTSGPVISSFVERLSSFRHDFLYSVYTRVFLACPLLGGLSSFRVFFIGGFTVCVVSFLVGGSGCVTLLISPIKYSAIKRLIV